MRLNVEMKNQGNEAKIPDQSFPFKHLIPNLETAFITIFSITFPFPCPAVLLITNILLYKW